MSTCLTHTHALFLLPQWKIHYQWQTIDAFAGWVHVDFESQLKRLKIESVLALPFHLKRELIRDKRNFTWRLPLDNASESDFPVVWVKQFEARSFGSRLRYALRSGKAARAWVAAQALHHHHIATPQPLAVLQKFERLNRGAGLIVFEDVPGAIPLSTLLAAESLNQMDRVALFQSLGQFLQRFHDAGFRHRDLQGGNVLVTASNDSFDFKLVDLNRMRRYHSISTVQRIRDLARLPFEQDDIQPFFDTYQLPDATQHQAHSLLKQQLNNHLHFHNLPKPLLRSANKLYYYFNELRHFQYPTTLLP